MSPALWFLLTACSPSKRDGTATAVDPDSAAPSEGSPDTDDSGEAADSGEPRNTGTTGATTLTHLASWAMDVGTHRPELAITEDGDLLVIVVEHLDIDGGRSSHIGYRFDTDFSPVIDPFVVAMDTAEFGHPADHRIALVDGELLVVYQSLIPDPEAEAESGPAEATALEQSLLIARFDPSTGAEISREPIAPHITDFSKDNFPDHCVLWHEDRLLVSTGTRAEEGEKADTFRIREIDPAASWPDNVLATHSLQAATDTMPSVIGNSLVHGPDGGIWMWGSTGPHESAEVKVAPLGDDFAPGASTGFVVSDREQTFPTGVLLVDDAFWVGHISRNRGGGLDLTENPYSPRLLRISADLSTVIADESIASDIAGASHVHPTLALADDRLYLAWSRQADGHTPQVVIEVYAVAAGA
jgi:hypothetical protein